MQRTHWERNQLRQTELRHNILEVQWDFVQDTSLSIIIDVFHYIENLEPTKINVVSMQFFNPLGFVSPVTALFRNASKYMCTH